MDDAFEFKFDEMPVLIPIPIRTKNVPWIVAMYRWVFGSRHWKTAEAWHFWIDGVKYCIPKGFEFDGASVPKVLRSFLSPTGILLIPGVIHDYNYRYNCLRLSKPGNPVDERYSGKEYWDQLFYKVAVHVNGFPLINRLAYLVLLYFGGEAWRDNRRKAEAVNNPGC